MSSLKSSDPSLDIARGLGNVEHIQLNPFNGSFGTGLRVWYPHSADPSFNTTPVTIEVWSASANDTGAGTGTRTVEIKYIDENMLEQTETLEMNGTTVVSPTQSGYRVNSLKTLTTGSNNNNVGDIFAGHSSKAQVMNIMIATENLTRSALWACGAKTLYLKDMTVSNGGTNGAFVSLRSHDIENGTDYVHARFHCPNGNAMGTMSVDLGYMKIEAGQEFYCAVNTGSGNTNLQGVINAVLI